MALSKLCKAEQGRAVRLRHQTELFRALADISTKSGHSGGFASAVGMFHPQFDPPLEKRYPYLDRDLLEFIYAVPREQLLRPGQRRSLMRRALAGIVPGEILNRKRKALVTRSPVIAISSEWDLLVRMTDDMISDSLGIVDSKLFLDVLKNARHTSGEQIVPLMRTVAVEMWLKNVAHWESPFTGGTVTKERRDEYLARESSPFPKQTSF